MLWNGIREPSIWYSRNEKAYGASSSVANCENPRFEVIICCVSAQYWIWRNQLERTNNTAIAKEIRISYFFERRPSDVGVAAKTYYLLYWKISSVPWTLIVLYLHVCNNHELRFVAYLMNLEIDVIMLKEPTKFRSQRAIIFDSVW